eukprot:TRINITY_DN12870_c0_g1_i1.p1 TRINITY_DN12870_c0_g1~~TRINITY_DN12870_c0_g1_i1.p1  ORF type:complete len:219 (-),score=81.87 TRINITY_DN12870_c0_g1_i1:111-767(-)
MYSIIRNSKVYSTPAKLVSTYLSSRQLSVSSCKLVRESENFTFDWNKVPGTLEKEREKFTDYLDTFGEARFSKPVEYQNRQYTTSTDPSEWAMVERYMVQSQPKVIPLPQPDKEYSSGFVMPTAKPGDYPYFVKRAPSWLFPVYVSQASGKGGNRCPVKTTIKRVEGNVAMLRDDLTEFLMQRYEQEFISQANELMQKVVFRGNYDKDFKEFLKIRGF